VVWASPYFACCGRAPNHDVDQPLYAARTAVIARDEAHDFARHGVSQGYAVLVVESLGSAQSRVALRVGDAQEAADLKTAIDWLNGQAAAWSATGRRASA
jgi:X-Pro dipeptidyl-peptidase